MRDPLQALKRTYTRAGYYYDFLDAPWEWLRYRKIRPEVWAGVSTAGRILDAGMGTGRNILYYPTGAEIFGVDLSETMLSAARRRVHKHGGAARLSVGSVTSLPFKSHVFNTVVSTFLFCVLPDELQPTALDELRRVLRPDGKAVLLEYVYSQNPLRRLIMRAMAPWVEFWFGARFDRRTTEHLRAGGWRIEREQFLSADVVKLIVARPPA